MSVITHSANAVSKPPSLPSTLAPVQAFQEKTDSSSSVLSFCLFLSYLGSVAGISGYTLLKYYVRPRWLELLALRHAYVKHNLIKLEHISAKAIDIEKETANLQANHDLWIRAKVAKSRISTLKTIAQNKAQQIPAEASLNLSIQGFKDVLNAKVGEFLPLYNSDSLSSDQISQFHDDLCNYKRLHLSIS
ncbi:Schizosaccharomyces specific protein [Schizosaccharomyces osmophilus]|uniref:Schizosaccharomyces specific protein n=1 Tax=Schizosaccharomyces osmophilus TaxID=2545709 RepID=A0AAE9W8T1_9SCHI|nr:Schizosaccharomyces specific protein [Schizosaccharomyces osmophilus]WBW71334.1 Schizosaccharomyces specific protein [Schizosaccharomyces osmophilus]